MSLPLTANTHNHQKVILMDGVAYVHSHLLYNLCPRCVDRNVHLHRLWEQEIVVFRHLGAGLDQDVHHRPDHGSSHFDDVASDHSSLWRAQPTRAAGAEVALCESGHGMTSPVLRWLGTLSTAIPGGADEDSQRLNPSQASNGDLAPSCLPVSGDG